MNKQRMLELADLIEKMPEHKFDMGNWLAIKSKKEDSSYWYLDRVPSQYNESDEGYKPLDCGTTCCIAGWAVAMKDNFKKISLVEDGKDIKTRGMEWLELTELEATNLFFFTVNSIWIKFYFKGSFDFDEYEDAFSGIKNTDAAFALRAIANGEVNLDQHLDYDDCVNTMRDFGFYEEMEDDDDY